jgi:hypothetical protein
VLMYDRLACGRLTERLAELNGEISQPPFSDGVDVTGVDFTAVDAIEIVFAEGGMYCRAMSGATELVRTDPYGSPEPLPLTPAGLQVGLFGRDAFGGDPGVVVFGPFGP